MTAWSTCSTLWTGQIARLRAFCTFRAVLLLLFGVLLLTPPAALVVFRGHSSTGVLPAAVAQASAVTVVQNVRICDVYGHSVILRWDPPARATSATVSAYYLTWQANGETTVATKIVNPQWDKPSAAQIQSLDPAKTYTVTIAAVDPVGHLGAHCTLVGVHPRATYEAELRAMTNNGQSGFLYLPENDPPMDRPDMTKLNSAFFELHAGDTGGKQFDASCAALNDQQHWHMIANDTGVGSITSRVKGAIYLADGGTRHLRWDCDNGPFARQTWYIVLTPNKVDQFFLFPNNNDFLLTNQFPREQIRIRFSGPQASVVRFVNGCATDNLTLNWRQDSYMNVRQRLGLDINQQGLTFLADANYDGTLQNRGSFATNLTGWQTCYAYFVLGSYDDEKTNTVHGTSASGQPQVEFEGGIMHWGNIAFDAPAGHAPATELSYFAQPNTLLRTIDVALDLTKPIHLNIPDPIPADAVARELVFTDRGQSIPCLTGTNRLRLSVNGVVLANKCEDDAWKEHPTYRWPIPAGVLKRGQNVIVVGWIGDSDSLSISNVHVDIHVPPLSPAIAAYTPPPPHPILDTMPDHKALASWVIPEVGLTLPDTPVSGKIWLPLTVSGQNTANLGGEFVPFDQVWATVNGKTVWSQNTNMSGVGSLNYAGGFWLDTTTYPDGYYEVVARAHELSGSVGFYNGSSWYSYDPSRRLIIHNGPKNRIPPVIQSAALKDIAGSKTISLSSGGTYSVKEYAAYSWDFALVSPTLLAKIELYVDYGNGSLTLWSHFNPAFPNATQATPSGKESIFLAPITLEQWWPTDANGQNHWELVVTDVDGNTAVLPFVLNVAKQTPPPPPPVNAPPIINCFTADPLTVKSGCATELHWSVTGADTVTIDNGIGTVSNTGMICVAPTKTTTYTLTAKNAKGTVTKKITVTVTP